MYISHTMKPTTISPETKKNELKLISLCFMSAFILNIVGIIIYKTSWTELFTQIHIVLILTVVFYAIVLIFRGLAKIFVNIFKKK